MSPTVLTILQYLDDAFEERFGMGKQAVQQGSRTACDLPPEAKIPNGFYTLTFADGSHRTFRVFTKTLTAKFAPGQRIIALLIGPENTDDYESFGFVREDGIHVWKRFANARQAIYAEILWNLATGGKEDGCELLISKRCLMCNRELTDPESIERGVGPICWERTR